MEIDTNENKYTVKGGNTILGKIFSYQERTGLSPKEILKLPYIQFVLGMLDAPQIDYDKKNKKNKKEEPKTVEDELAIIASALR